MTAERFNRPDFAAPLAVWEYAITLERLVVNAEAKLETAVKALQTVAFRHDLAEYQRQDEALEALHDLGFMEMAE